MRICFSGFTRAALAAIRTRRQLYDAKACIIGFHDTLLALAKGDVDIAEMREFFFYGKTDAELKEARYIGGVVVFSKKENK